MAIQTRQLLRCQPGNADVVSENSVDVCGSVDLGSPKWLNESDVLKLKKEIQEDESLKHCRELGERKLNGFVWRSDLLFHEEEDCTGSRVCRLVLPKVRRGKVLR